MPTKPLNKKPKSQPSQPPTSSSVQPTSTPSSLSPSAIEKMANSSPFPLSSYQLSPPPPLSFSAIIEQDHSQINAAAGQLLKRAADANTPTSAVRELLDLVVWRLVRHDVSEDLVMRPAFVAHLGAEGEEMTEHDRHDHESAKGVLLGLYDGDLLNDEKKEEEDGMVLVDGRRRRRRRRQQHFIATVSHLFAELAEHMRVESGEQIPRLESVLRRDQSQELARRYLHTQALTPELRLGPDGAKVWKDVRDYANTDLSRFAQVFEQVEREAATKNEGKSKL